MKKYKFLTSEEIIEIKNKLLKKYPKSYKKKIKAKLGLNDLQVKYLLSSKDKNIKKKLYELTNENDKFPLVKILESKYYMYNFFVPYRKIGGSIFLICTLIFTIMSLIFLKESLDLLIVSIILILISSFICICYYFSYKNISKLEEKLLNDNIIEYEATIKSVSVICPYENIFFISGKIVFLRVHLVSNEQNYVLVPINQIEAKDSRYYLDKKLTSTLKNQNIKIKSYKKTKFLISSSIDLEGISKKIINNY